MSGLHIRLQYTACLSPGRLLFVEFQTLPVRVALLRHLLLRRARDGLRFFAARPPLPPPNPRPGTTASRDDWYGKPAGSSAVGPAATSATNAVNLPALRLKGAADLAKLVEVKQATAFLEQLRSGACALYPPDSDAADAAARVAAAGLTGEALQLAIQAGMMTLLLHVESRVSSALGLGFYTIGPCGEELMACTGLALEQTDASALHYRHLAAQIARQLRAGRPEATILLDRARGHVVSLLDPISKGGHCLIGGGPYDFLVTSTLASQACPGMHLAFFLF